ncbi:MAG: hypothetical protein RIR09_2903, partial [Pseudomonadota bacterium]
LTDWACPDCLDLKRSNRPVRTRMPGGVAGAPPTMEAPYADVLSRVDELAATALHFGLMR